MFELKRKIITLINESNLSLEQIFYVLKDLLRDVEDTEIQSQNSKKVMEKQQEEQKDDSTVIS